jgi:dephospho-CoA kinase
VVARQILEPGQPAFKEIEETFGQSVIDQTTGKIDRSALMSLILEDAANRKKLNEITHSRILRRMIWEIAGFASKGHTYAVLDVPLLFEKRLAKWFHKIIVVTCERDLQMQRLMESRQMTERESGKLIDVQMSLDQKAALANYVVENSGNFQDLKSQIVEIHTELCKSNLHRKIRVGLGLALGGIFGLVFAMSRKFIIRK